jgi:hypothetical protein
MVKNEDSHCLTIQKRKRKNKNKKIKDFQVGSRTWIASSQQYICGWRRTLIKTTSGLVRGLLFVGLTKP